ncbi:uncharacterized protein LOC114916452 [Cajanus cajan]|uniref:uncharacterized protein LOC114916452 n=1 Tax=Cajanus cajan TaxID=3821 RepID=UPI0010FB100F|nr:uncharacterized protein LOC114916452 [Cajanus cajan]
MFIYLIYGTLKLLINGTLKLNAIVVMEYWCSHCCRLCPTRFETIYDDISVDSCCVCTLCGKVLLDLNESLQVVFPNKKINKSSGRKMGRNMKKGVQAQKKECDTSQTSENFEEA